MKHIFLTIITLFHAFSLPAQTQEMKKNIGNILWKQETPILFTLQNTSSSPLNILRVESDCDCQQLSYPQKTISSGEHYEITINYRSESIGTFHRTIYIYTNQSPKPLQLVFTGRAHHQWHDIEKEFPIKIGDIHLSTDNVEFDDVYRGQQAEKILSLYNSGKKNFTPELMHLPQYIKAYTEPEVIRPGKSGIIRLQLNSLLLPNIGVTQTNIYLSRFSGDRVSKENEITISSTLLPIHTENEKHSNQNPIVAVDTLVDLGRFTNKKKLSTKITLANRGSAPLMIKHIQVYNPSISIELPKTTIAPQEAIKLKITASSEFLNFKGRKRILLITNDPKRPKLLIDVLVKK